MSAASFEIRHDAIAHQFHVDVEGQRCELDYVLSAGVMTITHTGVPPAVEGRGIAAALVRAAFELAKSEDWRVIPACSYAAAFVRRHPEYATQIAPRVQS